MPEFSIIIPTYRHITDFLKPCLDSILRNTSMSNAEIIVVANGCTSEDRSYLDSLPSCCRYVWFDSPIGVPRGYNEGIKVASGEYIVLLNNDTLVLDYAPKDEWLNILKRPFSDPIVGITGPHRLFSKAAERHFLVFFYAMIHKKVIKKIGLLDEIFSPYYCEDMDYCFRAEDAGFKVFRVPDDSYDIKAVQPVPIWHKDGGTCPAQPGVQEIYARNERVIFEKYNVSYIYGNDFERAVIGRHNPVPPRESLRYTWALDHIVGKKVLEIGCSSGYALKFLKKTFPDMEYTGIDYDSKIIEFAKSQYGDIPGVNFEHGDIRTYDLKQYDTIIAFEVIEHLDNGLEIAEKLKKHCKCLLMTTPHNEPVGLWGKHHKLHGLTAKDFSGFSYWWADDNHISDTLLDGISLMYLKWQKSHKKVSVIVTNYNRNKYLDECFSSIRAQTFKDYELIFINDGGVDASNVARKYKADTVISMAENRGTTFASSLGVSSAVGDYVCMVNADDMIEETYLEKCVEQLDQNSDAGIVYTDFWHFGEGRDNAVYFADFDRTNLQQTNFILASAMFRRKAYNDVGGYDLSIKDGMEDYDLWLRICNSGWNAKKITGTLYKYRDHVENRSRYVDTEAQFKKIWKKRDTVNFKRVPVTVGISTRDRYLTTLHLAFSSVINQTVKPERIIIFEDGDPFDPRQDPIYLPLLRLCESYGIMWEFNFGEKKGQLLNHRKVFDIARTEYVWRIDDDEVAECDVLEKLYNKIKNDKNIAAVAGLILHANNIGEDTEEPASLWGKQAQWFRHKRLFPKDAKHLYSSFLYRRSCVRAEDFPLYLSKVAHHEETIFSHTLYRRGYKLLIDPTAITWHFRYGSGGIRDEKDAGMWAYDDCTFDNLLKVWGYKIVILDSGIGDHFCFKHIISELKEKHKNIIIFCCYPEVFAGDDIPIYPIQNAKDIFGAMFAEYNVYIWMLKHNWDSKKGNLLKAFRCMHLDEKVM